MTDRQQKVKELMESFQTLRRSMAFRPSGSGKMPRITPSQWGALMMIGQHTEGTVTDVAKALGISRSAATQLIDGLVASGYVIRKENKSDRRTVSLTLSPKSKKHI